MGTTKALQPETKLYDFSKDTPENRKRLLDLLGESVKVIHTFDEVDCGLIGWLFRVDKMFIKLKITSTRNENYTAEMIEIEKIIKIEALDFTQ